MFVAPDGNVFMLDIARWIVEAAISSGRQAELVVDRLPQFDGAINLVVAPHEFFLLRNDDDTTIRTAAQCSIPICTEQPGTPWFLLSLGFCVGSPLSRRHQFSWGRGDRAGGLSRPPIATRWGVADGSVDPRVRFA